MLFVWKAIVVGFFFFFWGGGGGSGLSEKKLSKYQSSQNDSCMDVQ